MKRERLAVVDDSASTGETGLKDPASQDTTSQDTSGGHDTAEQGPDEPDPDEPAVIEPFYEDLAQFVDCLVLPNYRHQLFKDVRWCARWWEHTAAVARLELLWEAFEHMRLDDPPAMSVWLRDHFDTHMAILTKPTGVFYLCDATEGIHEVPRLWPSIPAPAGQLNKVTDINDTAASGWMPPAPHVRSTPDE